MIRARLLLPGSRARPGQRVVVIDWLMELDVVAQTVNIGGGVWARGDIHSNDSVGSDLAVRVQDTWAHFHAASASK